MSAEKRMCLCLFVWLVVLSCSPTSFCSFAALVQVEESISALYNGRPVNIIGEVNAIL